MEPKVNRNAGFNVVALHPSAADKPTVNGGRKANSLLRTREYLTPDEVDRLHEAAGKLGRYAPRNRLLILMLYRHGLRVSEACALRWTQIDFKHARLAVKRLKGGLDATHPLTGNELRALRALHREAPGSFVFMSERGAPFTDANVQRIVKSAGVKAGLDFPVHPHMLRHACGFKLANDGVDTRSIQGYLGHSSIASTVRYTQLSAKRFEGFFTD